MALEVSKFQRKGPMYQDIAVGFVFGKRKKIILSFIGIRSEDGEIKE